MEINYSEILFETIGMIAGNQQSSVQVIQDEISEEEELAATPVVDPMADIIQMEKLSISRIEVDKGQTVKINKSWNFTKPHDYDLISLETSITATASVVPEQTDEKSYGIQLILSTNTKQHIVQFDSTEMLGNPYNFIQALQKKSFSLSEIKNLRAIEIKLFNNSETVVEFDNVNLVVGYSLASYTAAAGTLVLYTDDEKLEYETNALGELGAGSTRNIYARWVYQDDNDIHVAITHNNYNDLPLGVNVFWYKYSPNVTSYDEFGGQNWVRIDSNKFALQNYTFNPEAEQEQFKLVIIDTNQDNGQLSIITSNILTFTNKKEDQIEIVKNGVIKLNDDSNGIYPYYSWDGYIDDKFGYQTNVVRLMELTYNSSIEYIELAKKIKQVIWKIPQEHMKFVAENLEVEEDGYKIKGGYKVEQIIEEDTEGYSILTTRVLNAADREIETDGNARAALAKLFSTTFGIKGRRIPSPWKNDIVCSIILDDNSEYTFSRDVGFTVAGESGSEYSVIVRIKDAAGNICNAVPIGKSDYSLVMSVYDSNGESVINDCKMIKYVSFYSDTNIKLSEFTNENNEIVAGVYSIEPIGSFNAYGVIFTITLPSGNKLIKYFGIPVCASDINPVNVRYNGPSEIIYNHAGVDPKFNDSNIELIGANGITWLDKIKDENQEEISTLPLGFVLKTEPYQLTVGNSYFKEWTGPEYYLTAERGTEAETETVWVQPLLIYQNPYFSSLINEWDNALKIDNDNNVIFSSAYIAGSKDDENKFTGAILGELGKITDGQKSSSETGLFGYQEGTQIFGFKTDGTAFIGPSSGGRILINGNKGSIYSGNFNGKITETENEAGEIIKTINYGTAGSYFDLDDGLLIANNGYFRGHIEATSGEFTGNIKGGTISIGGTDEGPSFHVDEKGNVTLNGNITWGASASPTQVVYNRSNVSEPDDGTIYDEFGDDYNSTSNNGWHKNYNTTYDYYASYTYDGGKTWGAPIKIKGSNGSTGAAGASSLTVYQAVDTYSGTPPTASGTSIGSWSTTKVNPTSTKPYLYACSVKYQYSSYSNWGTPELVEVYNDSNINYVEYATYWKLTQGGQDGLYYDENGKLLINATKLYVEDNGSVIFSASANDKIINIGGFTVGEIELYPLNGPSLALYHDFTYPLLETSFILSPKGIYTYQLQSEAFEKNSTYCWKMLVGNQGFRVSDDGSLYITQKEDNYVSNIVLSSKNRGINFFNYTNEELYSAFLGPKELSVNNQSFSGYIFNTNDSFLTLSTNKSFYLKSFAFHIDALEDSGSISYIAGGELWLQAIEGHFFGTWGSTSAISTDSWRGAKHDIEQLDERYSTLFDNLNPVRFKYNNGTSDRYHTGLILDELKDAMDTADITTQEFAAYCVRNSETGEGGIRYEAFISLLIKEVQTLKQELKALKEEKEINNEIN